MYYFNQRMLGIVEQVLEERDQIIWIIDLSGKIMQLASKKILEALDKIIANLNHFFPDVLYRYYLILFRLVFVNTPMLFDTIWNKFADKIDKATQQKILMIGDEMENLY